jgi:hypothetical protein
MGILRLASPDSRRIDLGDGDWIEVVSEISKKTFNKLVAVMPTEVENGTLTVGQATSFQSSLFEVLVTGWSLEEPATVENYENLVREAATAIDDKLMEVFSEMTVGASEAKKQRKSRDT